MSKYQKIPNDNHVARRCSQQRLVRSEEGEIIGVSPAFFRLRQELSETDLSCNWIEHINGSKEKQVAAVKESMMKLKGGKGSRVVISEVGVLCTIAERFKVKLICKTKGKKNDPSYSGVYGLPRDNSNSELIAALVQGGVKEIEDWAPWPENTLKK